MKKKPEANKEEKDKKLKKGGGVKRTGIKSQISKFRKNLGKNKKKGDGFGFEIEIVEKKKDGNIETNQVIPEENNNENKEPPKIEENEIKTDNKENGQEKPKINDAQKPPEKVEIKIEKKDNKKEEPKAEEQPKVEKPKVEEQSKVEKPKVEEQPIVEKPKQEQPKVEKPSVEEQPIVEKPKEEQPKIEKPKVEKPKKVEPKKEKKEEIKEEKKVEENNNNDDNGENKEKPHKNAIIATNQESLNEFEKKLQLALEQEEKGGLFNKNENLADNAPVKQKKEDPKFDEIKSVLGKEIVDSLFSPKWEVKKHGFELINEFINNKPQNSYNLSDLIEYMKLKLKNYKETNFNINREAINIYINMIKKKIITKDLLVPIIIAYHEKLADIKLKENLVELINNSFDIIEPNNILKQIIGKISKKNNAKLLIEYSTFFGNVVEEYDVKDLPNKDIIDFCKVMANNSNPQVRTAAISLLCILYKYLGKDVKTLTRDIKESTLKLIDAELDKVTVIDPKESAAKKKKAASIAGSEGKGSSGGGVEI